MRRRSKCKSIRAEITTDFKKDVTKLRKDSIKFLNAVQEFNTGDDEDGEDGNEDEDTYVWSRRSISVTRTSPTQSQRCGKDTS